MLHRVSEEKSPLEDNRRFEITPAFLEQTMLQYKSANYCFVSLDEVQWQLESQKRDKRRFVCFTIDDGYNDSYEQAYPVFKKHNCPFAIYVTTNSPDKQLFAWCYNLQDVLVNNERLEFESELYDTSDLEKKNQVFKLIKNKFFSPDNKITLKALKQLFRGNAGSTRYDSGLRWEQICKLAIDPLCTIGAHTVSHSYLSALTDEEIRKELSDCKKIIEEKINKPVKHFSYPYGEWNNKIVDLVMQYYATATLAEEGLVRKGDPLGKLNRNILSEEPLTFIKSLKRKL